MRIPLNDPLGSDASGAPERRCILTGDHGSRDELLRLAMKAHNAAVNVTPISGWLADTEDG